MIKKHFLSRVLVVFFVLFISNICFATQNTQVTPGSQSENMDFSNLTRGLYLSLIHI